MNKKFDIGDFVTVETEQTIINNLVERFKKRRKEIGLTQKELSSRSGVSYGSIRRFESTGDISLSSLLKLSDVIGCLDDFNELFKNQIVKNLRGR
ncbi:helix-turn-helix domain-containing protein [Haploplasma axanthum]|uniref:Anaerobic benzoate catabolism transcriptional regulator n=1 Tax=Haploplasma axanthum TaxID=29552 RepID=A0A449BG93_HAPAX|nr:helix-turn-helix transcriptional regulator [Haploplasma axanthum]VEU81320.1 anaerobic benzoate catabolism transcriptional regulator [Haploplasma axanthum]